MFFGISIIFSCCLNILQLEDSDDEEESWEYWDESEETSRPEFLKIDEGFEVKLLS